MHLSLNPIGFYEALPKPSITELREFYKSKYYSTETNASKNQYAHAYSETELFHKTLAGEEALYLSHKETGSMFEIGYGEGFFSKAFVEAGWDVSGIDFTNDGLLHFHPELEKQLSVGDVFEAIDAAFKAERKYDFIALNNVLEHVINPTELLQKLHQIIAPYGLIRICVPNDGAWIQEYAVELDMAEPNFWTAYPEHLNYFNSDGLQSLLRYTGYNNIDLMADFPIDLFLLSPGTNYRKNTSMGSTAHDIRLKFETQLFKNTTPSQFVNFRRACASVGVGRNLIAYVRNS